MQLWPILINGCFVLTYISKLNKFKKKINNIFYSIDNDEDYEVGIQSNDYHSSSNYEKMDQKHEEIQCKAIGMK